MTKICMFCRAMGVSLVMVSMAMTTADVLARCDGDFCSVGCRWSDMTGMGMTPGCRGDCNKPGYDPLCTCGCLRIGALKQCQCQTPPPPPTTP